MTEIDPNPPDMFPSITEFVASQQRRVQLFAVMTSVIALLSVISYFALGDETLILPSVLLVAIAILIAIWHYPAVTFYFMFTAAALLELGNSNSPDAFLEKIPFFWNINTIVQIYARYDFRALPINMLEMFLLLSAACAGIRAAFNHKGSLTPGSLFWPIAAYIGFVIFGWVNGMATGGDFKISLQEVRPQFYFFAAYFMATNVISTPRHIQKLFWLMALSIGFKGILYTIRRNTVFAGLPLPDGGVGSHEEAFFFDCFIMLLVVLSFCGLEKRLRTVMWFLLPFVVMGNLATNRRAGTAAFIIVLPILLLAAYRVLPNRRKMIAAFSLTITILFPIYYFSFRHSASSFAQPARAIASQFEANTRDSASNAYRDAENADLMATIHVAPIQGYGYGKKMIHAVPIADISQIYEWWDIMTHNQVLWVWMRVGSFGMFAFWMMVGAIIIRACTTIRSETATIEVKAIGMYSMLVISMLMFFGLLDLQFSNYRDMLFAGCWTGVMAAAPKIIASVSSRATVEEGGSR